MKKNRVVIFSNGIPRILTGINPSDYLGVSNVVINPDLSKLIGIPPHHWKLSDGQIVEMSDAEKKVISLHPAQQSRAATLQLHRLRRDVTLFLLGYITASLISLLAFLL